jgi:hypothetical protein
MKNISKRLNWRCLWQKYSWCKAAYWYPTKNWGTFRLSYWLAHVWQGNKKHSLPTLDSSFTWDYNCFIQQRSNIFRVVPIQCKFDRNVPCCSKTSVSSAEFCCHILKWQEWFIIEFLHRSLVLRDYTSGLSSGSLFLLEFENTYKEGLKFCWWTAWTSQEASWISRKIRVFGRGNDTSGLHSD